MTRGSRAELREDLLRRVPARYSPSLHLAALVGSGLAVAAIALALLREVRAWQLAAVPVFVLLGNAAEWHVHRGLLHRRTRPLQWLYVCHTPQHHALYVPDDMALHGARELRFVLLPAYSVLALLAIAAPFPIAFAWLGQPNIALLFVATAALYVVAYEWLHLAWHMPSHGPLDRLRVVRAMRLHHAFHHAPHLRSRWNFNVTFPLWDLLHGTIHRAPRRRAGATVAGHAAR
jgi:sterol desaturase/sphingolipid hydroxylase (fatty acid hydroxylase superfamily)